MSFAYSHLTNFNPWRDNVDLLQTHQPEYGRPVQHSVPDGTSPGKQYYYNMPFFIVKLKYCVVIMVSLTVTSYY